VSAALRAEWMKIWRSPVGGIAAVAYVGGMTALCAVIIGIARSGDRELIAKLGPSITFDWPGLLSAAAQITAAGGFIASGVVLAWVFAREFADGTITGLFALPLPRTTLAIGKLLAFGLWQVIVSAMVASALLITGLCFGFGVPTAEAWSALGRQAILTLLTAVAVLPVAYVASVARSLMAAIGSAIALLVITQVGVLSGAGGWMPFAAPALWAIRGGDAVSGLQLGLAALVGAAVVGATVDAWRRLQLDR
jgi:ABC-2 type transport system permease protein